MKQLLHVLVLFLLCGCSGPQFLYKGQQDGVDIAYRWKHVPAKPTELLLRLENKAIEDKRMELVIDLYYQGRTVESLFADTCIKVGQTLNGKVNGFYFIPEKVSTEQIKSGDVNVEITRTMIESAECQ